MIPEQRRQWIVQRLEQQTALSINEIAETLGVSHMTVRRDVQVLEDEGRVVGVSGGVKLAARINTEPSFAEKLRVEVVYKRAIARAAAELVHDHQAIYLDAGTTVFQLVPLIAYRKGLTVVTNDFNTAGHLMDLPEIELFHTGGRVVHENRSAAGNAAAAFIDGMNFDVAFISTSSWDVQHGVTTPSEAKICVKRSAMRSSSTSVLLTDSTKYGRFGRFKVAEVSAFDQVITDDRLPATVVDRIRALEVQLIQCKINEGENGGRGT